MGRTENFVISREAMITYLCEKYQMRAIQYSGFSDAQLLEMFNQITPNIESKESDGGELLQDGSARPFHRNAPNRHRSGY